MKPLMISLIIPTYNRPAPLKDCLRALTKQDFEEEWEVIVVDDGSASDLTNVVENYSSQLNIRLIRQENGGPARARNTGGNQAKGQFIAFLDDDCQPEPSWLSGMLKHARKGVLVGGRTENYFTHNIYSEVSQLLVAYLYEYFKGTAWYFFTSNNFLMDRQTFLDVGGFDESFPTSAGEDREFCIRWTHLGYEMKYVDCAKIRHLHFMSLKSFLKLHFKYGGAARIVRQKALSLGIPLLKTKAGFYVGAYHFIFRGSQYSIRRKASQYVLFLLSQGAVLAGYITQKEQDVD